MKKKLLIPLFVIGALFAYCNHMTYSDLNERLEQMDLGINLSPYKIIDHKSSFVGGDDFQETYEIKIKGKDADELIKLLNNLCTKNAKWQKETNTYKYRIEHYGGEIYEQISICPLELSATYILYKR